MLGSSVTNLKLANLAYGDLTLRCQQSCRGQKFRRSSALNSELTNTANGAPTGIESEVLDGTDFEELTDLIRLVDSSDIVELDVKNTKFCLSLKKQGAIQEQQVVMQPAAQMPVTPVQASVPPPPPAAAPAQAPAAPPPAPAQVEGVQITSPMAGTLYRAPAPGEPPFCKEGDKVTKGQTICIIEAMKLMNEIEAEVSGEVVKIEVDNGSAVTPGQVLMIIRQQ